jgi:cytochrome o ubiquinol oxidase operon protein cyoD
VSAHIESHEHHDAHDHHEHDDGHSPSTLKGYMTGFFLAVVLTAIPFWLVMDKVIPNSQTLAVVILTFAAIQIVVHMIYFLHMNTKAEGGWSMLALIFTLVMVVITLSGSIWVMYHMNSNMMPGMSHKMTEQQAKNLP